MSPSEIIAEKNQRIIDALDLEDKQSVTELLSLVQVGWVSCRRAADEIIRVHSTRVEQLEENLPQ